MTVSADPSPEPGETYSESTTESFSVRRTGQDAYMFTSREKDRAIEWLHRIRDYGNDVELVRRQVTSRSYTRFGDWEVLDD